MLDAETNEYFQCFDYMNSILTCYQYLIKKGYK